MLVTIFVTIDLLFFAYIEDPMDINIGNGSIVSPRHGTFHLRIKQFDGEYKPLSLINVRFMPSNYLNMISKDILE